jgi:hypothetical protein
MSERGTSPNTGFRNRNQSLDFRWGDGLRLPFVPESGEWRSPRKRSGFCDMVGPGARPLSLASGLSLPRPRRVSPHRGPCFLWAGAATYSALSPRESALASVCPRSPPRLQVASDSPGASGTRRNLAPFGFVAPFPRTEGRSVLPPRSQPSLTSSKERCVGGGEGVISPDTRPAGPRPHKEIC